MSTFNTTNIESTSGGAPNFSQGLNVGGSDITSLITMTEYYGQEGEPSSPANGAVWWDGTDAYQYVGGAWRILSVTGPPAWFGDTTAFSGGLRGTARQTTISTVSIPTTGNATSVGQLAPTGSVYATAACSNASRGLVSGGEGSGGAVNVIQYVTFSSLGNSTDFGDLAVATSTHAGCSDGVYGLFGGGSYNPTNTIQYVSIAVTGNALDFGDLTVGRSFVAACADATYGVWAGGNTTPVNTIDYVTIATPGNATDFGDMSTALYGRSGCSNRSRGLFAGGRTSSGTTNEVDYIAMATPGNATDFGNLSAARNGVAACCNVDRAVFAGGQTSTSSSSYSSTIDYVSIETPGNATDFGDLVLAVFYMSASSGD